MAGIAVAAVGERSPGTLLPPGWRGRRKKLIKLIRRVDVRGMKKAAHDPLRDLPSRRGGAVAARVSHGRTVSDARHSDGGAAAQPVPGRVASEIPAELPISAAPAHVRILHLPPPSTSSLDASSVSPTSSREDDCEVLLRPRLTSLPFRSHLHTRRPHHLPLRL